MKYACIILGAVSLALGILGVFLPLLPTTPFLLLCAALWIKGSPRLYAWLIRHPWLGAYIRNYRENRAMPLRAKVLTLVLMWGSMLYCIFVLLADRWWAQAVLSAVAAGVTWHLLSIRTLKGEAEE